MIATGVNTYFGHIARSLAGRTRGNELRPWHQEIHVADDSFHPRDGAVGFRDQRFDQTQLARRVFLFDGGRRGTHAGNVADDCVGLLVQGAMAMSRKNVIVKRLNAIQNLARWMCFARTRPAR